MKMTLTEGLAEVKAIGKKLEKKIERAYFVDYCQGEEAKVTVETQQPVSKFEENAKASLQSIQDLFSRHEKIKAAIAKTNAETKVTIGKKEYTIAEAIGIKNTIDKKEALLGRMTHQYSFVIEKLERINREQRSRAHQETLSFLGGNTTDTNRDLYEKNMNDKLRDKLYKIYDPVNLRKKIEDLEEDIIDFKTNVDVALSKKNALTEFEID